MNLNESVFVSIPDEILSEYIFPFINNKTKMLLSRKFYIEYHNLYYPFSYKYLIFLVKNNIIICKHLLKYYTNFEIYRQEKIKFDKKIFFYVYDFCIYIAKKYNNCVYIEYFTKLHRESDINNTFSKLRIKQYKNFVNKNILWTK